VVTGEDYAIFQDIPGRHIFKIHGSIYNYGSIVATQEDYNKCYHRLSSGLIGARLKDSLVSKTIVFVRFSFADQDFQRIYRLLSKEVKGMIPRSYVVTLDEKAAENLKSQKINATPIITSASFFISMVKKQLVQDNLMLSDEIFVEIPNTLDKVIVEHGKTTALGFLRHPNSVYSPFYQDGLAHAFQHILNNLHTGTYSDFEKRAQTIKLYEYIVN